MSTFKGIVAEFPRIRIDYFRQHPDHKPPLACFLSHVHSDHLAGLESIKSPFVYCSAATREILLRLEKLHYRMNFARGILESRNVTYQRSMARLARPLPLETPTTIELSPGNKIRVTLLDANHCVGAVMFLIEGDGKAILYTGDIRAETWWVNSIVQNPVILPYTYGTRRLDCIYLDTTFATKSAPYREFPTKADGIRELLEKVSKYPEDTIFYFHSWTFGYENVWIALSSFLDTNIHLDHYRARIYGSLSSRKNKKLIDLGHEIREAPALCGFQNGNHFQPGCLTDDPAVRLHSCERGMGCPVIDHDNTAKVVHIVPIVTRINGAEIAEIGAGGGKGDLDQQEELETGDVEDVEKLMELCANKIDDPELLSKVLATLQKALDDGNGKIDLGQAMQKESQNSDDGLPLQTLISVLSHNVEQPKEPQNQTIHFPYSRHSSYSELCTLVDALKPKDVYPCTVDEKTWCPEIGMYSLFGRFCSGNIFRHDAEMIWEYGHRLEREQKGKRPADTQESDTEDEIVSPVAQKRARVATAPDILLSGDETNANFITPAESAKATPLKEKGLHIVGFEGNKSSSPQPVYNTNPPSLTPTSKPSPVQPVSNPISLDRQTIFKATIDTTFTSSSQTMRTFNSSPTLTSTCTSATTSSMSSHTTRRAPRPMHKKQRLDNRHIAELAAKGFGLTWADYGGLVSTRSTREQDEQEL